MDNPQQVLKAIEEDRAELIRLSGEYDKSRRELGKLEFDYEQAMATALVNFELGRREIGEKLPAEDVRRAHTHRRVDKEFKTYLEVKASVDSLEKLIRIRQAHMSSLQSELAFMTEELRRS